MFGVNVFGVKIKEVTINRGRKIGGRVIFNPAFRMSQLIMIFLLERAQGITHYGDPNYAINESHGYV